MTQTTKGRLRLAQEEVLGEAGGSGKPNTLSAAISSFTNLTLRRHLLRSLTPGAIVAFHEVDFPDPQPSYPPCPVFDQVYFLLGEAFRRSGALPGYGRRVGHSFLEAGLPFPTVVCEGVIGGGRASYVYAWAANTLVSVAPLLKQLGLSVPPGIPLDHTLAAILEEEAVRLGSQNLAPVQYRAWTRIP